MKIRSLLRQNKLPLALLALAAITFVVITKWIISNRANRLPDKVDFNYHIRPILSNNCFTCHGPDEGTREAGLRLDTYEGATQLLKSGERAIVPGKVKESALLYRIRSEDESLQMPPPSANKELTNREIKLIKKWIAQGAEWKKHWAFIPPKDPTKQEKWAKKKGHPIDLLMQEKLKEKGLKPAPSATAEQLLRRLAFTLTGLPPGEYEKAFANDYDQLVEYYLNSPHFGEHWARHWMDLVRYADTRGHEFDYPVNGAWHYRDYLIRAFNEDVPYNQLVKEQLAGDLLQEPRLHPDEDYNESILGTTFYTMGEGTHSPVDIRKDEADRIDNMIDVCTKTFQALTVSCARCHDHKFDPIPTADYYAMYGIFESTRFAIQPARTALEDFQLIDTLQEISGGVKEWIAGKSAPSIRGPLAMLTNNRTASTKEDTSIQVIGDFRNGELSDWMAQGLAFALPNSLGMPIWDHNYQLQHLASGKASSKLLGKGLIGGLRSPTFTIEKDKILVRAAGKNAHIRIVIDNFQLIQYPIYGGLEKVLDSNEMEDYVLDVSLWKGRKAYIELANGHYPKAHAFELPTDAWIEAEYAFTFDKKRPDRLPLAVSSDNQNKNHLANWLEDRTNAKDVHQLNDWLWRGLLPTDLQPIASQLQQIEAIKAQLQDTTFFAGVTRGDRIKSPVFFRGDHGQPEKEGQTHRFFSCLNDTEQPFSTQKDSRLQLAEAIIDPSNPITARVYVNRVWHHLFGRGIVETVDNFGLQGSIPSHPELLDHLAVWFMENGWSTKALIRYIVQSNTFQLSTTASAKSKKADPENLLLQQYPIRRLEAESIRDAILVTSGSFDSTQFGVPVPIHLTEFMQGRGRPYESGPLDGDGRRSIYLSVRRNFLHPFLLAFDMPVPFSTFGKRNNSNVPAQSLTLMNDPFVAEQAQIWAKNVIKTTEKETERIQLIFQQAFCRKATQREVETAMEFLQEQAKLYDLEPDQIKDHLPLWTDFCHSVFNMKGFIYLM